MGRANTNDNYSVLLKEMPEKMNKPSLTRT
jgi:hypothetical protein